MTGEQQDTERLRTYLLGTLPADERERLEIELLRDDALYEALLALEDEAVHDLAAGGGSADLAPIAARLGSTAEGRRRLAAAHALVGRLEARPPARRWLPALAAAAAVLVLAGLVWFLATRQVRQHGPRRAQEPTIPGAVATPAPSAALATASPAPELVPTPAVAPLGSVVTLALQTGLVRGGSEPARISLRPTTATVRLRLTLPPEVAPGATLRATLLDADGAEVWRSGALHAARRELQLDVAATELPEGDYELALVAEAGEQSQPIAEYSFGVLRER